MREIGSEFHYVEATVGKCGQFIREDDEHLLVFSGRTAIETVLENERPQKAMLPSYCCDSMIEPFRRAGISVCFYSVFYNDGIQIDLVIPEDVDCLLWCNYFGFQIEMPDLSDFVARGGIIIEDITHSFYAKRQYHQDSHYLVASLRKWEPILCGGYCVSRKGPINSVPITAPPSAFLELKGKAMQMKARFLDCDSEVSKNAYLQMFSQSNKMLAEQYSGLKIDDASKAFLLNADHLLHAKIRRYNAAILYEFLQGCSNIRFLFERSDMDCPLFVPVILEADIRDAVRKKLIENQIYCPIHWPRPNADCKSNLYDLELSLVCDQRYNEEDMRRISDVLQAI